MNIRIRIVGVLAAMAAFVAPVATAQAQSATITGKVVSEQGNPLLGANATMPELGASVGSNTAGIYTITIPGAQVKNQTVTLRMRAIGYVPVTRQVVIREGTQTFDFTLRADVNKLSQVVVTGVTGATEATKVPFATNTITAADLPVPATNPLTQIAGKVPGANIVSANGRPGAQPAVLLRGPTAISASGRGQDPLYIVDGVILNGPLPSINPQDIESVEVVKGAAAASLYGARAGNGVISITTKSGKGLGGSDGVRFSYRGEYGSGDVERNVGIAQNHGLYLDETGSRFCTSGALASGTSVPGSVFDCARTINYQSEAFRINDQGGDFALAPVASFTLDPGAAVLGQRIRNRFQAQKWPGATYDAVQQFAQPSPFYQNNFDMTGRYGRTSFFASLNQLNQGGSVRGLQGYRRQSVRANIDHGVGSDWNFSLRSYYARSFEDGNAFEEGGNGVFFRLTRVPPISNLLRTDSKNRLFIRSNIQASGTQNFNPIAQIAQIAQSRYIDRFISGASTRYTPNSWLDLEANLSYDNQNLNDIFFFDKGYRTTGPSAASSNTGGLSRNNLGTQAYNGSLNATIRKDFGSTFRTRLNLRTLYEQQDGLSYGLSGNVLGATSVTSPGNVIDQTTLSIGGSESSVRQISYFAGVNLEWKDRYIIDALIRRDGSSLFGSANRWANFGRVSMAYRLTQEGWFKVPGISEFKLRGSYGTAGGRPSFSAQYETFAVTSTAIQQSTLGNKNLKPETIGEYEVGFDAEFFNRIGVNFTYAESNAEDQILLVPAPAITGFQNQWRNAGTLNNQTFELAVNVPILTGRDLSWSMRVIYDRNRTTITKLDPPPFNFGAGLQATDQVFRATQGRAFGEFWGRLFLSSCEQLPTTTTTPAGNVNYQAECQAGRLFAKNNEGYLTYTGSTTGNPTSGAQGITRNLWQTNLPAAWAPWGAAATYGHPIVLRDNNSSAVATPLGNALPDYRWAVSTNVQYKRFTGYVLVDATMGRGIWNQGRGWAYLDFLSVNGDQTGRSVETAKPMSYNYRAGSPDNPNGLGGFYDILGVNSKFLENTNYAKVRELAISYRVGRVQGLFGDWNLSMIGRNLYTFTNYRGFDPEVGLASGSSGNNAGSSAINSIDAFTFPNTRTFTFSLSTTF